MRSRVAVLGDAEDHRWRQCALRILRFELVAKLVRTIQIVRQTEPAREPLQHFLATTFGQHLLVPNLLEHLHGRCKLLRELQRVAEFEQHFAASGLGIGVALLRELVRFVGGLAECVLRDFELRLAVGGVVRVGGIRDADLRLREPEHRLIRELRKLVDERRECLARIVVLFELHEAEADSQRGIG